MVAQSRYHSQSWGQTVFPCLSEGLIGRQASCFVILWARISTWIEITNKRTLLWCKGKPFKMLEDPKWTQLLWRESVPWHGRLRLWRKYPCKGICLGSFPLPFHSHDTIFHVTLVTLQLSQEGQGMLIRIASASEGPNEISRSGPPTGNYPSDKVLLFPPCWELNLRHVHAEPTHREVTSENLKCLTSSFL